MGMAHNRQPLPFLLETGQTPPGVHARLDELEGDVALDRLSLPGGPDLAHAALAQLPLKDITAGNDDTGAARRCRAAGAPAGLWGVVPGDPHPPPALPPRRPL